MKPKIGYCDTCNNTGEVDCYCGGDLCCCGQQIEPCSACDGGDLILGEHEDPEDDMPDDATITESLMTNPFRSEDYP